MLNLILDQMVTFVLILTRLGGLIMVAPGYGGGTAPPQVRGLLAVGISFLIAPLFWGQPAPPCDNLLELALLVAREALLGVAASFAMRKASSSRPRRSWDSTDLRVGGTAWRPVISTAMAGWTSRPGIGDGTQNINAS